MSKHKWTQAQYDKFNATMEKRKLRKFKRPAKRSNSVTDYVTPHSMFFRIKNGKPYPVRVKRVTLLVLE